MRYHVVKNKNTCRAEMNDIYYFDRETLIHESLHHGVFTSGYDVTNEETFVSTLSKMIVENNEVDSTSRHFVVDVCGGSEDFLNHIIMSVNEAIISVYGYDDAMINN